MDATQIAEYLYSCVEDTIVIIIPYEIKLLQSFDGFKEVVVEELGFEDNKIKLLRTLLLQNEGRLSDKERKVV